MGTKCHEWRSCQKILPDWHFGYPYHRTEAEGYIDLRPVTRKGDLLDV